MNVLHALRLALYYVFFLVVFNVLPLICLPLIPLFSALLVYHYGVKFIFKFIFKSDVVIVGPHKDSAASFEGIILMSHKSHMDFWLGHVFGNAATLGRLLVALACPFMTIYGVLSSTFIVFNRGKKGGRSKPLRERFALAIAKRGRLIIFPEGHRLPIRGVLTPFRTGALAYAFHSRTPVMVAPTEGAQAVINYATGRIQRGMPVVANCCGIFYPDSFEDMDEFINTVEQSFIDGYTKATEEFDRLVLERFPGINLEQVHSKAKPYLDHKKIGKQKII
ncbi:hypothetical protein RCL1_006062 [Eukaryota sp. TZLM3-RCL]